MTNLLSRIYDFANDAVTADVDNESTTTDSLVDVYDHIVHPGDDLADIINNQLSSGEAVWIGAGTHTVTNPDNTQILDTTVSDVTVDGPEGATVKLGDNEIDDSNRANVIRIAADDVTLCGQWTLDWNKANNGGSFSAQDPGHAAILIDGTISNTTIKGITVKQADVVPIWEQGTDSNNRAENTRLLDLDLLTVGKGPVWDNSRYMLCENVYLDTVTSSAGTENGFDPRIDAIDWQIINCWAVDVDDAGYYSNRDVKRGLIDGCYAIRCGQTKNRAAIHFGEAGGNPEDIRITNTVVLNPGDTGILWNGGTAHECRIEGNYISGGPSHGINATSGVLIQGNVIEDIDSIGIRLSGTADRSLVFNNKVFGNTNTIEGIREFGNTETRVAFNYIDNCPTGIRADGTDTELFLNWFNGVTTEYDDRGTRVVINREVDESANAEEPQTTAYPTLPVFVDFTDSGDASGDGIYYIDQGQNVHGPI